MPMSSAWAKNPMRKNYNKQVILVVGPTAVGKTSLAIRLALHFHTEILSADSRQCYREMDIGVARPTPAELALVQHHFIASHSISEALSAAGFERYALDTTETLFRTHQQVVVVGGTGLYVRAFTEGLDELPPVDPAVREAISRGYETGGLPWLQQQVKEKDPHYFDDGEILNPRRLMRALEVVTSTGRSIRSFQVRQTPERPFSVFKIGLDLPRDILYDRINQRVDAMMDAGLLEEVTRLYQLSQQEPGQESMRPPGQDLLRLPALQTVGYQELFEHLQGKVPLATAVENIKRNTRHYAKRQLTWFRKDPGIQWFHPGQFDDIVEWLAKQGVV